MPRNDRRIRLLLAAPLVALAVAGSTRGDAPAAGAAKDVTVSLCDGESQMTVPGLKPGVELPRPEAQGSRPT